MIEFIVDYSISGPLYSIIFLIQLVTISIETSFLTDLINLINKFYIKIESILFIFEVFLLKKLKNDI